MTDGRFIDGEFSEAYLAGLIDGQIGMAENFKSDGLETLVDDEFAKKVILPNLHWAIGRLYEDRGMGHVLDERARSMDEERDRQLQERAQLFEEYGFETELEAQKFIASFWPEETPSQKAERLGESPLHPLSGLSNAVGNAREATKDDPELNEKVRKADTMTWRNYRGGHGG